MVTLFVVAGALLILLFCCFFSIIIQNHVAAIVGGCSIVKVYLCLRTLVYVIDVNCCLMSGRFLSSSSSSFFL